MASQYENEKPPAYNEAMKSGVPGPGAAGYAGSGSYPGQQYQYGPNYQSYQSGAPPGPVGYGITVQPQTQVVVVGGCPSCRVGILEDDFTCLGVFCAIFFFPLGILCCLAMRQRRCPNCGAIFG